MCARLPYSVTPIHQNSYSSTGEGELQIHESLQPFEEPRKLRNSPNTKISYHFPTTNDVGLLGVPKIPTYP